jgi:hypothetical protein
MYDDPCPNCGHRRKRTVMSTDPEAPGIVGLWKGEGNVHMQGIAKIGTVLIACLILVGVMQMLHITL